MDKRTEFPGGNCSASLSLGVSKSDHLFKKKKKFTLVTAKWIDLENITLSEGSQRISLICGI